MKLSDKQKNIVIASSLVLSVAAVFAGYSKDFYEISQCKSEVEKYIKAEFSETTVSVCIDSDGGAYTCMDTDYWSEPASEVFKVETTNGKDISISHDFNVSMSGPVAYPPMPPSWPEKSRQANFDRFSTHTDTNLSVWAVGDDGATQFNESISSSESCYKRVGMQTTVKTWYGITYGSDF